MKQAMLAVLAAVTTVVGGMQAAPAAPKGTRVEARQVAPVVMGAMGDSTTDAYRANDNRGGTYRAYTFNYIELLVRTQRAVFGSWGTFSEPRRTDYARNWARSGATTTTLLDRGQHTGLAAQVESSRLELVVLSIGANDFHPNSSYRDVYTGTTSDAALQRKVDRMIQQIVMAGQTVIAQGTNLVIMPVGDYGMSPGVIARYPDATKRLRVTTAIAKINAGVASAFAGHPAVAVVSNAEATSVLTLPLVVGTVTMNCAVPSDNPRHCFLGDGMHAGTVLNGLVANVVITKANAAFGFGMAPLTHAEILAQAGIR